MNPSLVGFGWGPPPGRAGNASMLGGGREQDMARIVSILRSPVAAPVSTLHFAPGNSDLERTVAAQQTQLDALVDRVASVLSMMHAELQNVAHKPERAEEVGAMDLKLRRVQCEVEKRFDEFGELRSWVHGRIDALSGRLSVEVEGVQLLLSKDACGLHERLAAIEAEMHGTNEASVPQWQLAVDRAWAGLRQEIRLSDSGSQLEERMLTLEQQVHMQRGGSMQLDELRAQLKQADTGMRRQGAALEHLMGDIRQLRQATATHEEFLLRTRSLESSEAPNLAASFDPSTVIDPLRSRIVSADQRIDAVQERIETLSSTVQQVKCSLANGTEGADQRLKAMNERADALTASFQQFQLQVPAQVQRILGSQLVEQRLDEMRSQVSALAEAVLQNGSRNLEAQFRLLEGKNDHAGFDVEDHPQRTGLERTPLGKPPLSGSGSRTTAASSGRSKSHHRSVAETELAQTLEVVARQLEVLDDLLPRVGTLEEQLARLSGGASPPCDHHSLALSQTFLGLSQTLGDELAPDNSERVSSELNGLKTRMSSVESSLKIAQDALRGSPACSHEDLSAACEGVRSDVLAFSERLRELEQVGAKSGDISAFSDRLSELEEAFAHIRQQPDDKPERETSIQSIASRLDTLSQTQRRESQVSNDQVERLRCNLEEVRSTSTQHAAELAQVLKVAKHTESAVNTLRPLIENALASPGSISEDEQSDDGSDGSPSEARQRVRAAQNREADARSAFQADARSASPASSSGSNRSGGEDESLGCAAAKVVLCRLQSAEDDVAELLREFPRTPSARRHADDAEACLQQVREQAERMLAPVAPTSGGRSADEDTDGACLQPTFELRGRVEQLLRGKLICKLLARRLRRLIDAEPASSNAQRLADAEEMLLELRGQLRSCLEDAMRELRRQVDELVPPTSDEEISP